MEEDNKDKEEEERDSIFKKFKFDESSTTFKCSEAKFSLSPLPIDNNIVIADNNDNNTNNTNNSIVNVNNVHINSNCFDVQRAILLQDKSKLERYIDPKHANFRMPNGVKYDMMTTHYNIYKTVSHYYVNWEIMKVLFIGKIKDKNSVLFYIPLDVLKLIIQYYRYDNNVSSHTFPRIKSDPEIPDNIYNKELKSMYNKIIYDSDTIMRQRVIDRYLRQKKLYIEKPIPNESMYYLTRILNDVNKILKLIN